MKGNKGNAVNAKASLLPQLPFIFSIGNSMKALLLKGCTLVTFVTLKNIHNIEIRDLEQMPNVNKVILMGVLGRDPETKQFPNGGSVTTFSVATTEHWKDKTTNERKEATEWHRISTNNRLAEIASKYLKKGSKVYIEGSLRTRKWKDQSGADREVVEVRADVLQLL